MDGLGLAFLGLIALGSLTQVVFFIGLGLGGWRLVKRLLGIKDDVARDLRPVIDSVSEISRNVMAVSEVATVQVRQLQDAVNAATDRLTGAREEVRRSMRRPFRSLGAVSALFKGMRRGVRVYRQLGGLEAHGRGSARRYGDDEHLFI